MQLALFELAHVHGLQANVKCEGIHGVEDSHGRDYVWSHVHQLCTTHGDGLDDSGLVNGLDDGTSQELSRLRNFRLRNLQCGPRVPQKLPMRSQSSSATACHNDAAKPMICTRSACKFRVSASDASNYSGPHRILDIRPNQGNILPSRLVRTRGIDNYHLQNPCTACTIYI